MYRTCPLSGGRADIDYLLPPSENDEPGGEGFKPWSACPQWPRRHAAENHLNQLGGRGPNVRFVPIADMSLFNYLVGAT